jgi:hypothetical protein
MQNHFAKVAARFRRRTRRGSFFLLISLALLPLAASAQQELYQLDLAQAAVGSVPSELMVLNGEFVVKEDGGQRFIELPGAPLDTFQLLFGPNERTNVTALARCWGSRRGRQFPTFAVGLSGQAGFRLQVSPAKAAIELYKGDEILASKSFAWESDKWTWVKVELVRTGDGEWTVRGKAWNEGATEPADWLVSVVQKEEPQNGRASLWGSPFSGKAIRFDSLKVARATPK